MIPLRHGKVSLGLLLVLALSLPCQAQDDLLAGIDIPYQRFVLDNGLTLLVHEDHKAPVVAVNVWYHVGSKDEKPGKTGFAHLFEHLMFNGSENFDDDYFKKLEPIGATDLNGTTSNDRTNYFQTVPTSALDLALWMESDRMGHLLGAINQEKLDEQRGVVQNEKRQGENQPYGKTWELIAKNTYPTGHPYSWTVIGSMEDLDAASLDDVHNWFKEYYGAANTVIAIAGDITAEEAHEKVKAYFGDIPSGPPLAKQEAWVAKRTGSHRVISYDRVPQARLYKVWNVPELGTEEGSYLELLGEILSSGKTSRLYKRLVYEDQIATDVSAYAYLREIAGQFYITATARPGQDLQAVEQAIDEELDKLLKFGPTEQELKRVKTTTIANFVKGIERVGGFGGKSDILASYQVFCNDPAFYKVELARYQNATVKTLLEAGNKWLADGVFNLEVRPFPEYKTIASSVDRTTAPEPGEAPKAAFPAFQRKTLTNGMTLLFAERHSAPMVQCALIVDAGYAADSYAQPGTASLAMNMLDEGTTSRDALQISEELDLLGASIGSGSSVDVSTVTLNTLKTTLAEALTIYADIVLNPSFPEKEFLRLQKEQIARIQREKVTPMSMAVRVFPKLLYGEGHAYSNPLTGSGTEESVAGMTVADLKKFHETWFKPNNTTIVIVGDTQLDEITDQVEKAFASWKPGDVPQKKLAEVPQPEQSTLYLIDRPGSEQSVVLAGLLVPSKADPQDLAIATMNYSLGGAFTSRINMNLREDKHWTYGARSMVLDARAQRPFLAYASVQMDKTKESIQEIIKECLAFTGDTPPTEEELSNAINAMTLTLPGDWETMGAVLNSLSDMVNFGLPDDYYATYADSIRALQPTDVAAAAARVVKPSQFVWVVVGDRAKIETSLTELGFAQIQQLDADGRILQP